MNIEEQKLIDLQNKTQRTLFTTQSVWPFEFFPDIIRIDENKVDLIYHTFFFNHYTFPVFIKNINGVTITTGIFFASLSIEITGFEKNPDSIHYLPKEEARKAKRIILGLVAANKDGIDVSKVPASRLLKTVEEIGRSRQ